MDIWQLRGGNSLEGACFVQGSKNASLPIIAASLICPLRAELMNVPRLRDVDAALRILRALGCRAQQSGGDLYIDSAGMCRSSIERSLMMEMRSSVFFMGALLARCGRARLSLPGGCQLGARPIDMHLAALRQLGVEISEQDGEICCEAKGLHPADIHLPFPSVGATENIMLCACAIPGETRIINAAREPEIVALQDYLRTLGANIRGAGSGEILISGMEPESHVGFRMPADRIAAATFACATAAAGGDVELRGVEPEQFSTVTDFINEAGCDIIKGRGSLRVKSSGRLRAVSPVSTGPYPAFPTDAQPVLMAALLKAEGESEMQENIFENRYRQVPELRKLGADIELDGRRALIRGVRELHGTELQATDLRGGAAMIVAALCAEGESTVMDTGHIRRGYEELDSRLRALGAEIRLSTD